MKSRLLPIQRWAAKVCLSGDSSGCWEWLGSKYHNGYGEFGLGGPSGRHGRAHRFAYERFVGEIPEGLQIDHLCRNRGCVNPAHLEAVTQKENMLRGQGLAAQRARQTRCFRGHPLSGDNLRIKIRKSGLQQRQCRECEGHTRRTNYVRHKTEKTPHTPDPVPPDQSNWGCGGPPDMIGANAR